MNFFYSRFIFQKYDYVCRYKLYTFVYNKYIDKYTIEHCCQFQVY